VTGLTSNPTTFEHAIGHGSFYDEAIARLALGDKSAEEIFFALALEDLTAAADLFRPVFDATRGMDGWVSLEVSPLLVNNTAKTIQAAVWLHQAADRPNLFIKIPGTVAGTESIEESIFRGVSVNVTLLFSREHYLAAAEAYMRGIERRLVAGLDPNVRSVASLFVSRWDVAVKQEISPPFHNRLGIAIAMRTYKAYRDLLASSRWLKLAQAGARPQRLLWASTGTKDPAAPDTLYVEALAAADTINTIPEKTLHAFADHGMVGAAIRADGGYAEAVLQEFRREGVDDEALAARLQREGAESFTTSWHALLACIREKSANRSSAG
jgi:transaldolase